MASFAKLDPRIQVRNPVMFAVYLGSILTTVLWMNSLVAIGSELVGQNFTKPEYFWGRLSATQPVPYNAAASSGSNFGPLHPELKDAVEMRIESLRTQGREERDVPVDLVTSSASGLDPHISPAAAEFQVPRIAKGRRISEETVRQLVHQHTQGRQFGVLGEPRINVLQLNLALDQKTAK